MSTILALIAALAGMGIIILIGIGLVALLIGAISPEKPVNNSHFAQAQPVKRAGEKKGETSMLPQHLWDKINKIVEENTGVKIPRPRSIEEILAQIPARDRKKLLPVLIPIVVDAIKESTGMDLDASLALREFLLGKGLGLTEHDILIESDAMKMEKTLAARERYKKIVDTYRAKLPGDPVVDFIDKMFTFKLVEETFKDIQLPPGWSTQNVAKLLELKPPKNGLNNLPEGTLNFDQQDDQDDDKSVFIGEIVPRR